MSSWFNLLDDLTFSVFRREAILFAALCISGSWAILMWGMFEEGQDGHGKQLLGNQCELGP